MSTTAMATVSTQPQANLELKDPLVAAGLAWLVPGLGHIYQGRTAKGLLFLVCILSTFYFGLYLSGGKAVYAAWLDWDRRMYYYVCQLGVGLAALPALLQTYLVRHGNDPMLGGIMAPPETMGQLNDWHRSLHHYFELGTVYTMIAGLLNILAIYDAWGGPVPLDEAEPEIKSQDAAADQPAPSGG